MSGGMIGTKLPLRSGELITLIAFAVSASFVLAAVLLGSASVVWLDFVFQGAVIALLAAIGVTYRLLRRDERIAASTLATALLLACTVSLGTYNYLLLPISRPLIDPWLAETNALVGYRWSDWVEWLVAYPWAARAMREIYLSSMWQVAIVIVGLGFCDLHRELDRMLTTLVLCAVGTIVFWGVFPSIGVSAFEIISAEATRVVGPVAGAQEGAKLLQLVHHGSGPITPRTMTGLIGFPSFHTVLAFLCLWFGWKLRWLRLPFLLANLVMIPAILIHGSHYVIDLFGGAALFFGMLALTDRILAGLEAGFMPKSARLATA